MIYEKFYASDIIQSTDVSIMVKTDKVNMQLFTILIDAVCQGIKYGSGDRNGFGSAASCNYDVNCPYGITRQPEIDAAVLTLVDGAFHCSATLLNNQCQDFKPFVLTADHCVAHPSWQQYHLWTFRFKYESGNPLCPGKQSVYGNQGTWFTMSGSQLRARYAPTDCALLEINGSLPQRPDISLAGWDRSGITPTFGFGIHHPVSDAKKISLEINPFTPYDRFNIGIQDHWRVVFDYGIIQNGSSGSGLFDNNKRIVGNLRGNPNNPCPQGSPSFFDDNCWCVNNPSVGAYGRFDYSWEGGGSNSTRLRNWLNNSNSLMTLNTIRTSWISPYVPNNGVEYVCTTNKLFTLNDQIPGSTVSWSVSNPSLFAISGGAATSGTGFNATLRAASPHVFGSAILTFTMANTGCNNTLIVTRQIWVGKPGLPITSPTGIPAVELIVGNTHTVYLSSAPGATTFTADWFGGGAVSRVDGGTYTMSATFQGNYVGSGRWQVVTSNSCGTKINTGQYNVVQTCQICPRINLNNPVQNVLTAMVPETYITKDASGNRLNIEGDFILMDQNGLTVRSEKFQDDRHTTDVSSIKSGLYILRMKTQDYDLTEKVVIIK
ncbi:MAG: T9SS type A sorting domain-containing protein [Saprospiraceae bacterium]|nr:T9SS type A sorting domain-containing protein [Saprospiraceae bacterium]